MAETQKIAWYGQQLRTLVGLSSSAVGVRFLADDVQPHGARVLRQHRYCQALMRARRGESVLLDRDGIACPAAAAAFGFRPLPAGLQAGKALVGFWIVADEASEAGFDPLTVQVQVWDHKVYYPGARTLHVRLTGDRGTGQLLGAQIVGPRGAEVSKRVDVFAVALFSHMPVEALSGVDLSYTPPLGTPWDAVQMAAQTWIEARGAR